MKAIIWLGNPDEKYEKTRHNVGFLFVDWLTGKQPTLPVWKKKFQWLFCELVIDGEKVLFLKPQTYMNRSGSSVKKLVDFYKLSPGEITIVSDDVDMEFGKVRFRDKGSAGGHNGLSDIFRHLDTTDIARLKIGIWRHPHMETSDWVLSRFGDEEMQKLEDDIFPKVATLMDEKSA